MGKSQPPVARLPFSGNVLGLKQLSSGTGATTASPCRAPWRAILMVAPQRSGQPQSNVVVIPGSRGTLSYLVQPIGDGESHAWSLAHGAGRKWSRSESRQRARERYRGAGTGSDPLGGRVVCEQRDLLYEEAPMAYKPIETVIEALEQAGLVNVIATLRPLLTYKTRVLKR